MENLQSHIPNHQWNSTVNAQTALVSQKKQTILFSEIIRELQGYISTEGKKWDVKKWANFAHRVRVLFESEIKDHKVSVVFARNFSLILQNEKQFYAFKNLATLALQSTQPAQFLDLFKQVQHPKQRVNSELQIDPKFVCDQATFEELVSQIQTQIDKCADFDTPAFLRGGKGISVGVLKSNEQILDQAIEFVQQQAKILATKKNISLEDAYKLLIGTLDYYDDVAALIHKQQKSFNPPSTFVLRSAILLAGQRDGIGLHSWMVYTKSGKPDFKDIWSFFNNWQNWVPEAQGAMAKFAEATLIKAKQLAAKHPGKKLILLKGGFGAGKTRLAGQLLKKQASGVIAPDLGKRVVRRSIPSLPHALAHLQGSQIAYKLFEGMIKTQMETLVYDSSLSKAEDISNYLKLSKKAGKKVVIYDVARQDMARVLAVLKRDVGGDDPRIPPDFIIRSAIQDKLNRAECMQLILQANENNNTHGSAIMSDGAPKVKPSVPDNSSDQKDSLPSDKTDSLAPEYHFIGGNAQGWNTEELMILTPNKITAMHPEMKDRLALEGIEIDEKHLTVRCTKNESDLKAYFNDQFERTVKDIMQDLSKEEKETLEKTFHQRELNLQLNQNPINDVSSFYEALPDKIKKVLSKKAVEQAFDSIRADTREQFFHSIQSKNVISYLDLPLKTALILHQNLQEDPWL